MNWPGDCQARIGGWPATPRAAAAAPTTQILRLIDHLDHLNGVFDPAMELWQCDMNRSGVCNAADILRR